MYFISVVNDATQEEMEHVALNGEQDALDYFDDAVLSFIEEPGKYHIFLKNNLDITRHIRTGLGW